MATGERGRSLADKDWAHLVCEWKKGLIGRVTKEGVTGRCTRAVALGRSYVDGWARQAPVDDLSSALGTSASISQEQLSCLEKERSIESGVISVLCGVGLHAVAARLGNTSLDCT